MWGAEAATPSLVAGSNLHPMAMATASSMAQSGLSRSARAPGGEDRRQELPYRIRGHRFPRRFAPHRSRNWLDASWRIAGP